MKTIKIDGKPSFTLVEPGMILEPDGLRSIEAMFQGKYLCTLENVTERIAEQLVEDLLDSKTAKEAFYLLLAANKVSWQCPEFPYFGANYPDARCMDGFLWDLDKCDDYGGLYGGGEEPCPFCNTEAFFKHHHDPWNDMTKESIVKWVTKLKQDHNSGEHNYNPKTTLILINPE